MFLNKHAKFYIYGYYNNMRIGFNTIKYPAAALFTACSLGTAAPIAAQTLTQPADTFELAGKHLINPVDKYTQEDLPAVFRESVNPSSWTNDPEILKNAPDPYFTLKGKKTLAKCVVDITNCRLYVYDKMGEAVESFRVALGAPGTPTKPGIRKVLAKQVYPYRDCPAGSKRRRHPNDYGPKIAYVNEVDTITGAMSDKGAYFHGTRHERAVSSAYRYVTHSCTRGHNRDALYIINDVLKIGDFFKYVKR